MTATMIDVGDLVPEPRSPEASRHLRSIVVMAAVAVLVVVMVAGPAVAATTEVRILKYSADGNRILSERTVNASWMESNLPVQGDGATHYYHQGPTFNASDPWDPAEFQNIESRDMGAVKGTALRDLCRLVGGLTVGDMVKIRASDGFYKNFTAPTILAERPGSALPVICWYNGEESMTGDPQGVGYVPDYDTGIRLVFFADTETNEQGWHVFGNEDMHADLTEKEWHFYNGEWPSSSGLSVRDVDEILIYPAADSVGSGETTPSAALGSEAAAFSFAAAIILIRRW